VFKNQGVTNVIKVHLGENKRHLIRFEAAVILGIDSDEMEQIEYELDELNIETMPVVCFLGDVQVP
jgi:hypothetical protein